MIYTDFQGEKISQLGMGTMRLPVVDGDNANIDEAAALEMFDYAYKHGINYFDTAWGYHDGNAELVTGKALSRYPRESFHLTTKFPGYDRNHFPKVKEIFAKQLEKLQTEYFDFYLFHNVCEYNIENYLNPAFGVKEYLVSERAAGRRGASSTWAIPTTAASSASSGSSRHMRMSSNFVRFSSTGWTGIFRKPKRRSES